MKKRKIRKETKKEIEACRKEVFSFFTKVNRDASFVGEGISLPAPLAETDIELIEHADSFVPDAEAAAISAASDVHSHTQSVIQTSLIFRTPC